MKDNERVFVHFSNMLKVALGAKLEKDAQNFLDMVTDDIVMEFPYAPDEAVKCVKGRDKLAAYLTKIGELIQIDVISEPTVHHTLNENIIILEFSCEGKGVNTHKPYNQQYISVITLHQGKIQRYQDYWNPLIAISTLGNFS